jgi:hypothetical protein
MMGTRFFLMNDDESDFEVTPAIPEETIQMLKDHLEASEGLIMAS